MLVGKKWTFGRGSIEQNFRNRKYLNISFIVQKNISVMSTYKLVINYYKKDKIKFKYRNHLFRRPLPPPAAPPPRPPIPPIIPGTFWNCFNILPKPPAPPICCKILGS